MSDDFKQYATQEMVNTYAKKARGVIFGNKPRYVLTTRNDGGLIFRGNNIFSMRTSQFI
ncbi:hypothetical protein NIES267_74780 (plasmid) [Calothrix parasitica NIES-267]|uniref:Uncharacterized protein n=1 Tax=Calothrix parasitica NIES-267 TaxID=1973488 RepID=A0A1Z4M378_9CYAN|nr:hypothetical protein NIES267_74780 [Calothrix parasitica NIES-267]